MWPLRENRRGVAGLAPHHTHEHPWRQLSAAHQPSDHHSGLGGARGVKGLGAGHPKIRQGGILTLLN